MFKIICYVLLLGAVAHIRPKCRDTPMLTWRDKQIVQELFSNGIKNCNNNNIESIFSSYLQVNGVLKKFHFSLHTTQINLTGHTVPRIRHILLG